MKKFLVFNILLLVISCGSDSYDDDSLRFQADQTINLNLPQYVGLQTAGNFAYVSAQGGSQGIIVQNRGVGSMPYIAWERTCPYVDCNAPMAFDGSIKMTCSCDAKEYSILDGSELPSATSKSVTEYRVIILSATSIRITNY